jgi:hypothetical protein
VDLLGVLDFDFVDLSGDGSSPNSFLSISNFLAALRNLFCVIPFIFSDSAIIKMPAEEAFLYDNKFYP